MKDLSRPLTEVRFTVRPEDGGLRLDSFLSDRVPWRSRTDLQRRIREGRVHLDGKPPRKSARVQPGQVVTVLIDEGPATEAVPVDRIPLRILWEDDHFVALDKTPGTIVHPVGRHVTDTLINVLHARSRSQGSDVLPMIVHRLDKDTSGVLVLAKHVEARRRLGADFETRKVAKTYLALAEGRISPGRGTIDLPIGPDPQAEIRLKMACVQGGRPSRTDYEVLWRGDGLTLVRCRPRTGRQHQIRVHLAAAGHPILGDVLYGRARSAGAVGWPVARQALHSESLAFIHPMTGARICLRAPLAEDLGALCPGAAPTDPF